MPNPPKPLTQLLIDIGHRLQFDVLTEVEASESAWVDVVWFDRRLPVQSIGGAKPKMRYAPVLPVVAFEVEFQTGLNAKHVKGSVSNLSNLGAQLGVIVMGQGNLTQLRKQPPHANRSESELKRALRDRAYRWVYAEAQPRGRVIVMFEDEVVSWSKRLESYGNTSLNQTVEGLTSEMITIREM